MRPSASPPLPLAAAPHANDRVAAPRPAALKIFVGALAVEAEIGLYAQEQNRRQPLIVEIEAVLDPRLVEAIGDTVDYDFLAGAARRLADEGHIPLVEQYAQRVAAACLTDPRVRSVRVRVQKPNAVAGALAGVEVTFDRLKGVAPPQ